MKKEKTIKNHTASNYLLTIARRLVLVLVLFLFTRIGFYLFNRYLFASLELADWPDLLRGGLRFDLAALFYLNGLYMLLALLPFPFVFSKGWQLFLKAVFLVTNGVGFFVQFFDFVFFRTTLRRTDFTFFREFANETSLGPLVAHGLADYLVVFLLWVVLVFLLWVCYGRTRYPSRPVFTARFFFVRTGTLMLTAGLAVVAIRGGTDRTTRPITLGNAAAYVKDPLHAGVVLNTPFCIVRTLGKPSVERLGFFSTREEMERIYSPVHTKETHPVAKEEQKFRNVVVFILESFSREYSGALNNGTAPSYTPFLDSLAAHSLACTRAYANGRKSVDALPSILGSIPSLEQPFALTPYALNRVEGLGNALKKTGYYTAFFHGAPNGSLGLDGMSRQFGFDTYYGMQEFGDKSLYDGYWGIWDEPFLQFSARTLDTFPEPFVAAVFTLSSHHPFVLPKEYEDTFPPGTDPVHRCIGYTDYALQQFFTRAAKSSWYERTLFVFVADHGTFSRTNPHYQTAVESMAIFLMYFDPSGELIPEGLKYEHYTQQIDIMPTVLEWLEYPYSYFAFGRNIRDSLTIPFVVNHPAEFSVMRQEKEKEPGNELFLKAFRQQYNNRLLDDRLIVTD